MKSTPFLIHKPVPFNFSEGDTFIGYEGVAVRITRIQHVKFSDCGKTVEIIGLCVEVQSTIQGYQVNKNRSKMEAYGFGHQTDMLDM